LYTNYIIDASKKNKNNKKKKQNCSFDDRIKINYINYNQDWNEIINSKAIKIQTFLRSFISRYKFYKKLKNNIKNNKGSKYSENKFNLIKLKNRNKKDNFHFNQSFNNNGRYIKISLENINKSLIAYKNDNFSINSSKKNKTKKLRNQIKVVNNKNVNLMKQPNKLLAKEKEEYIKEKKLNELKINE